MERTQWPFNVACTAASTAAPALPQGQSLQLPRFSDFRQGDQAQFPGWPQKFTLADNDDRKPTGYLPEVDLKPEGGRAVVQVMAESPGETIYVRRFFGVLSFAPPVFAAGNYTVKTGVVRPARRTVTGQQPQKR